MAYTAEQIADIVMQTPNRITADMEGSFALPPGMKVAPRSLWQARQELESLGYSETEVLIITNAIQQITHAKIGLMLTHPTFVSNTLGSETPPEGRGYTIGVEQDEGLYLGVLAVIKPADSDEAIDALAINADDIQNHIRAEFIKHLSEGARANPAYFSPVGDENRLEPGMPG